MPDHFNSMADMDFSKARLKAFFNRVGNFLSPEKHQLLAFDEVKSILKIRGEEYRGVIPVPLEMIIGSEGRYRDFARGFLPKYDYLRDRWVKVDSAHYQDIILPPIKLYELGGAYFVRDGNHRVSVAKLQGALEIDAEVVSLGSNVRIQKGMGIEELKEALIAYEKKEFYAQTLFGQITDDSSLDFTTPGAYDQIVEHILVHKYYLNEHTEKEIDFVFAIDSWYREVYLPIAETIHSENLAARFPGRTVSDLYLYIVKHWDSLKRSYSVHLSPSEAAKDFATRYGSSLVDTLLSFFSFFSKKK
jgi:hypothetical protein